MPPFFFAKLDDGDGHNHFSKNRLAGAGGLMLSSLQQNTERVIYALRVGVHTHTHTNRDGRAFFILLPSGGVGGSVRPSFTYEVKDALTTVSHEPPQ